MSIIRSEEYWKWRIVQKALYQDNRITLLTKGIFIVFECFFHEDEFNFTSISELADFLKFHGQIHATSLDEIKEAIDSLIKFGYLIQQENK